MGGRVKLSDLAEDTVLRCMPGQAYKASPLVTSLEGAGVPWKITVRRIERMVAAGLLAYGTSPNFPWLTPKGVAARQIAMDVEIDP